SGDRVGTASGTGKIHSLDKKTGRRVWSHNLYTEFDGTQLQFGYSCHGLPYKNTLIYLSGGRGDGAIAFRQSDGAVIWKALEFTNSHAAPLLIHVDGQALVVAVVANTVLRFDPANGKLVCTHEQKPPYGVAVSTRVWARGTAIC